MGTHSKNFGRENERSLFYALNGVRTVTVRLKEKAPGKLKN
jgi:hypothetical protein